MDTCTPFPRPAADEPPPSRRLRAAMAGLPPAGATLGDVLGGLDGSARGLILLFLSIPAIVPTPGVPAGMVFGTVMAVAAVQMMRGGSLLRLPRWLARRPVPRGFVEGVLGRATAWLERIERRLRPRAGALAGPRAERPLGLLVLVQAVLIALPIPFGNVLPGLAVAGVALGLIARDGYAVAAGLGLGALAAASSAALVWGTWLLVAGP